MEFTLRTWCIEDLDSLLELADNPNIARFLTDQFPHPYSREAGEAFITHATQGNPPNILAIDICGRAVGAIGIHPQSGIQHKNAEMGYWLGEPFWGKGIMSRAIPRMADYAFTHFDINRIFARPFGNNRGSQRALEKAGFTLEARFSKTILKNGEYLDELFYALLRDEHGQK